MKAEINPNKIVVLSGAGISAESGLSTFRASDGVWQSHAWQELASPEGWRKNPQAVLAFYNERRRQAWEAQPNPAHLALAALQDAYEVVIITQNVDNLHERAGSKQVLHVHGELAYARGQSAQAKRYLIGGAPISLGQLCEDGTQLRPDIVWFGEEVQYYAEAQAHIASAAKVLVVGTSLAVFPIAGLVKHARYHAQKILVALDEMEKPWGYTFMRGKAGEIVPALAQTWLAQAGA
ncbi:Sir2 family NAD-dependent protein deacetylase [Massilia sp. W12]|uniref:SIR2 family NAD-dependent protein deacylase n=1 Tax=Massilia sp. W12 TaxID=3126507 RepID=UPI0030CEC3F2